jgi:hypothetical protein
MRQVTCCFTSLLNERGFAILKKTKHSAFFLPADQNIPLDVAKFQRWKPHAPLLATTTFDSRRSTGRASAKARKAQAQPPPLEPS